MMINIGECMNFHAGIGICCERRGIINSFIRQRFQGFLHEQELSKFHTKTLEFYWVEN